MFLPMKHCLLPALLLACTAAQAADPPKVVTKDEIVQGLNKPAPLTRSIAPVAKPQITTQAILFQFGTAELEGAQSLEQIRQLGQALADPRLKDAQVEIQGHTDNVGSAEFNQRLSEQRAQTIALLLTQNFGIPAQNLKPVGKGKSAPVAGTLDTQTDEQRALNRRVVVERVK
jgi:outer membrane protein OmpA-like peptidoglycan-associated protein